jgi:hypothetical protein
MVGKDTSGYRFSLSDERPRSPNPMRIMLIIEKVTGLSTARRESDFMGPV